MMRFAGKSISFSPHYQVCVSRLRKHTETSQGLHIVFALSTPYQSHSSIVLYCILQNHVCTARSAYIVYFFHSTCCRDLSLGRHLNKVHHQTVVLDLVLHIVAVLVV